MAGLPEVIASEEELNALLTDPTEEVERALAAVEGDLLILGVAGKMGPTLAQLARRAVVRAALGKRSRAWAGSASSNTSAASTGRRWPSSASTTPSTCAMACCWTWPLACGRGRPSTSRWAT